MGWSGYLPRREKSNFLSRQGKTIDQQSMLGGKTYMKRSQP
jgi:hypothetical protein